MRSRLARGQGARCRVWRRIYIDKAGGYARWIDIFENTAKSATTLPVEYYTNLGGSISITTTTSDKPDLTGKDWGIVTADSTNSSRPAILHIFANRGSQMKPTVRFNRNSDDFRVNYKLKIPAGRKVAICQFEAQRPGNSAAVALMKSFKPRRELDKIPRRPAANHREHGRGEPGYGRYRPAQTRRPRPGRAPQGRRVAGYDPQRKLPHRNALRHDRHLRREGRRTLRSRSRQQLRAGRCCWTDNSSRANCSTARSV